MSVAQRDDLVQVSFACVEAPQRERNHKVLQPVLVDLIALGLAMKQLHWNVIGPNFRPIHLHLDEIYAFVEQSVDEVAERLVATGHSPDGRIPTLAKKSELMEVPEGFQRDAEVLLLAANAVKMTDELIRERMADIEEIDTATADLLHQIALGLEKHHWMLQAQRA